MMDQAETRITEDAIVFPVKGDDLENGFSEKVEGYLRYYYSRRLFVQNMEPLENGYSVRVGIAYPRDVSDCRKQDNVLKMVNIGDVETFQVTSGDGKYYQIHLQDRSDVYESFRLQRKNLLTQLDGSMANAIYEKVYKLSPVRNQLNAVVELIDYVRNDGPLPLYRLDDIQSTGNTERYIEALVDLDFLRVDDSEVVSTGAKIDMADDQGWSDEKVIGQVIKDGYTVLRQKFGLSMLKHFPVFANGYYLSAFRRGMRELHLTREDVIQNLKSEYHHPDTDPLKVDRKLQDLHDAEVLVYDGEEVSGVDDVFDQVSQDLPAVG